MNLDFYSREPLGFEQEIPIFSERNAYTANYEQISGDHLAALRETGINPFIEADIWNQAEQSTIALVRKYSRPGEAILDVGVGLARLLSHFPTLRRFGTDISLQYLQEARANGVEVCYALADDLPYRDEAFDMVVCTDVIEHVLDLNRSCERILSTLKPDGILVVRVPYREDLTYYASPECPYRYVHLRTFDEPSLRLFFERVMGCEVVETTLAAYAPYGGRLKFPLNFPKRDALLRRVFSLLKAVHPPTYQAMLRRFFLPIEINVVVRKRAWVPHSEAPCATS